MLSDYPNHYYLIALLEVKGVGEKTAKKLIRQFGSAKNVFNQSKESYSTMGRIGEAIVDEIEKKHAFTSAKKQLDYCEENSIQILDYNSKDYPQRLHHCEDAPLVLYYKGNTSLNNSKVVSIVGTRNATPYGKKICRNIVEELSKYNCLIISGLAFGVDVCSHQEAIKQNTPTVAVLAQGLDNIYPREHRGIAKQMQNKGGVLTEYKIGTLPKRENFPKRNRIVAGMSDAIIVIESALKGGSMITAQLGKIYNREVFAVPGRVSDIYSEGCNHLIKNHQAQLLQHPKNIADKLRWNKSPQQAIQKQLFVELTPEEEKTMEIIKAREPISIDDISIASNLPVNILSTQLLMLEFKGIIRQLPGKKYETT